MISRIVLGIALVAFIAIAGLAVADDQNDDQKKSEPAESTEPAEVILRGNKIGTKSPVVALADVIKDPKKYENKKIIVEGTINTVCQKKGCWMEVQPAPDSPGVRVTFKDYGFFVPMDAAGYAVRCEGKVKVETLSKEDADHYEAEGAAIVRNDDGTATEIGFVAYGVELRKNKK